jgi:hypothetical protein
MPKKVNDDINMSDDDIKSLVELNKKMYKELKEQKTMIENLQKEQIKLYNNTEKMCNHINFINETYDKIKNGYFFKGLFK